ncbi:hypothetical protein [Streptomyces sp. NPDC048551]|uniref:hypothetical protein n=1 Tax=Streptomyces sp. NPDC048551 TaxID=3155758 RepID=UPI00341EB1DB
MPVRLPYSYDLAALVDDLVPLLEEIQRPDFSETEAFWGSDTFSADMEDGPRKRFAEGSGALAQHAREL